MGSTHSGRPGGRRRRQTTAAASVAVVVLAVGGIIGVQRSDWLSCRSGTELSGTAPFDYLPAGGGDAPQEADFLEQVAALPGVGELLGSATLSVDAEFAGGAEGQLVLSDSPYAAEENEFRDTSFDPVSGETSWSRGHPGQMAVPRLMGPELVTFGAVGGGSYRVSAVDATTGRVQSCVDLEREGDDGIGMTASAISADGSALAVARPAGEDVEVTRIDPGSRQPTWSARVDQPAQHLEWIDSSVVTSYEVASPATDSASNLWQRGQRVSLRALDAESGQKLWSWPTDVADTAPPRMASLVPSVGSAPSVVVLTELTASSATEGTSRLIGADPRSGEPRWELPVAALPDAVAVGDTIVMDDWATTGAVDATSGEVLWEEPTPLDEAKARLDVDLAVPWGEQLVVPTWASGVVVLDPRTGVRLGSTDALGARSLRLSSTPDFLVLTFQRRDGSTEMTVFSREAGDD